MRKLVLLAVAASAVLGAGIAGCGDDKSTSPGPAVSSRAYKGHANDLDMNNLIAVYPDVAGSRLDDCQTCHTGGSVTVGGKAQAKNACDFCHYLPFPDANATGAPTSYKATLNPFGSAYLTAGRTESAMRGLRGADSDGDGATNESEIDGGYYPGNASSKPGQPKATMKVLDLARLQAMPVHSQFGLANTSKQQFDSYSTYKGVTIKDLLTSAGVDLAAVTGVTVIAVDGFMKDFAIEAVANQYPNGVYYAGLDAGALGSTCGFVTYPTPIPAGLTDRGAIPDAQWLLLAYERDGAEMEISYLDPVSGKINGEGPLRLVVPQRNPGAPDRGSSFSPSSCNDGFDYDDTKEHNAGSMVRGVVAIRVNPMPTGYEEFDAANGGWAYVNAGQLILYGQGVR